MARRTRLAQTFNVNGMYDPRKISAYINPSIYNGDLCFTFQSNSDHIIVDTSNYSRQLETATLLAGEESIKYTLDAEEAGVSGAGSMFYKYSYWTTTSSKTILEYPLRSNFSDSLKIYVRTKASVAGNYNIELYKDGEYINQSTVSATTSWSWISVFDEAVLGNGNLYNIGIHFSTTTPNQDIWVDQIWFVLNTDIPSSNPETATDSPYLTVHGQIYTLDMSDLPDSPLGIYDYKSSLYELKDDRWYNFDAGFVATAAVQNFTDNKYAFVLSVSGSNQSNFISWHYDDIKDISMPSAYF